MGKVDLHTHTTASDGWLAPAALVQLAAEKGLRFLAITDHDTTGGLDEAMEEAERFPGLTVIPGIELSTDVPKGEVHVLGYFINYKNAALQVMLQTFRDSRVERARRMVEKLGALGMPISWERVQELSGDGSIGRPHIAQALVERGFVGTMREAFDKYIGRTGPAYAERHKLLPEEAVRLIITHGGLPVLAHPAEIPDLATQLVTLKEAGLIGIEVYYADYPHEIVSDLNEIASRYDLVPCGGSDFHSFSSSAGVALGSVDVPESSAERLMLLAQRPLPAVS